jgi:hypothetical protein
MTTPVAIDNTKAEAGFTQGEVKRLPHDFQNSYFITTKSEAR